MSIFGGAPQVVQEQPVSTAVDTQPTVDKSGLQDWMKGIVTQAASTSAKKSQSAGFNLGQAAALGGGAKGSLYGGRNAFT